MSSTILSRRAILAGAASASALAVPAAAAAVAMPAPVLPVPAVLADAAPVVPSVDPDAELIALGEQLKAATAHAGKLKPDRRLWEACWQAAYFEKCTTRKERAAADRRFKAVAKKNGYGEAHERWDAACSVEHRIAQAILNVPSYGRVGDGVRAAATLSDGGDDVYCGDAEVLWEMAARAGFPVPAWMTKKLKRNGIAKPKRLAADPVVNAAREMQRCDLAIGQLHKQYGDDAVSRDDYQQLEAERDTALEVLRSKRAKTLNGMIAKAEAVSDRYLIEDFESHGKISASLAEDVLRYFGQHVA